MNKIIMSGNPDYGLARAFHTRLGAKGFSRSNGFDFSLVERRREFARLSLQYSTYLSCSCLDHFHQVILLEEVYQTWQREGHQGRIVVLGSSADSTLKATSWRYPTEKKALRSYCRSLSLMSLGGHGQKPSGILLTYLSPGYLRTPQAEAKHPGVHKLDLNYIASLVQWILDQPPAVNISELCLDPVQCISPNEDTP